MKKIKKANCHLPKYDFSGLVGMSANMLSGNGKGSVADDGDLYEKIKDGFKKAMPFAGLAGSSIYTAANPSDDYSNEKSSTLGMGLQGAAMGSKFGGIYGAIGGGLLGAGIGWYGAKKRNIEREEADNNLYNAYILNSTVDPTKMKEGNTIHINPKNEGKFTKYANSKGMSIQEAAHWVMANSSDPKLRKRAQFAINATKFHHPKKMEEGGETEDTGTYISMPVKDKNNLVIPQMYGSIGDPSKGIPITHIQTEKGEKIGYPDGSIFDIKAKEKHEKMDKDEVTDILPQGSYIFGARDKQAIKKKTAEKISMGNTPIVYNEFDNSPQTNAEEIKLSDLFKKEEHTPAELAEIVKKKFKLSGKSSDAFTDVTNEENKVGRIPYLMNIMKLTEDKKKQKNVDKMPVMQEGGIINRTGYLDGSPTSSNPINIIPSGNITMDGVKIPLMAYSDKGEVALMKPGEKYKFKGKTVAEIPISAFLYSDNPNLQNVKNDYFDIMYGKNDPKSEQSISENKVAENGILDPVEITADKIKRDTFNPDDELRRIALNNIMGGAFKLKNIGIGRSKTGDKLLSQFLFSGDNFKDFISGMSPKQKKDWDKNKYINIFKTDVGGIQSKVPYYQDGGSVQSTQKLSPEALSALRRLVYAAFRGVSVDNLSNISDDAILKNIDDNGGFEVLFKYAAKNGIISYDSRGNLYRDPSKFYSAWARITGSKLTQDEFNSALDEKNGDIGKVVPDELRTQKSNPNGQNSSIQDKNMGNTDPESQPIVTQSKKQADPNTTYKVDLPDGPNYNASNGDDYADDVDQFARGILQMPLSFRKRYAKYIQQKLKALGYEISDEDGVYGPSTVKAEEELLQGLGLDTEGIGRDKEGGQDTPYAPDPYAPKDPVLEPKQPQTSQPPSPDKPVVSPNDTTNQPPVGQPLVPADIWGVPRNSSNTNRWTKKGIHPVNESSSSPEKSPIVEQPISPQTISDQPPVGQPIIPAGIWAVPPKEITPISSEAGPYKVDIPNGPTSETSQTNSNEISPDNSIDAIYSKYGQDMKNFSDKYQQKYADYFKYARGANAAANAMGILGTVGQSSYVNPGLLSNRYANQMFQKVPNFVRDANKTESLAPIYAIGRNQGVLGIPTSTTMSRLAPMVGNAVNSVNQTNKQFALDDVSKDNARYKFMQDIDNKNLTNIANAQNRSIGMDNYKMSQVAGFGGRALTGDATLAGKELGTNMGLEKQAIDAGFNSAAQMAAYKIQQQMMDKLYGKNGSANIKVDPYKKPFNGIPKNSSDSNGYGLIPNSFGSVSIPTNTTPTMNIYKAGDMGSYPVTVPDNGQWSDHYDFSPSYIQERQDMYNKGGENYNSDSIKGVQKELKDMGYEVGNIDGIYGKKTKAALKSFIDSFK